VLVLRFSEDGSTLLDSAEAGGSGADTGAALALPPAVGGGGRPRAALASSLPRDNVYVAGGTESGDFVPTSPPAFQKPYGGGKTDGFVLRFEGDAVGDCDGCQPGGISFSPGKDPDVYVMYWIPSGCPNAQGFEVYLVTGPTSREFWGETGGSSII